MTTSGFTLPRDPTDVVGRRIGAALIDQAVAILVLVLALVIGSYHFYERVPTTSAATAVETCDAFNEVDDPSGPTSVPRDSPPANTDKTNKDTVCIPIEADTVYVDMEALIGAVLRFYVISTVLGLINPVAIQGFTGASIGKHLVGLRVVRADGRVAAFGWHVLRYLLLSFEGGLIGLILICVTRGHRRLGDMASSTYVVDKADVGVPVLVPPKPGTASYPYPATVTPVDGPHWDGARGAYIRYDRARGIWLQWSEPDHQWRAIDT